MLKKMSPSYPSFGRSNLHSKITSWPGLSRPPMNTASQRRALAAQSSKSVIPGEARLRAEGRGPSTARVGALMDSPPNEYLIRARRRSRTGSPSPRASRSAGDDTIGCVPNSKITSWPGSSRPPNHSPWPGLTRPPSARAACGRAPTRPSASANHQSALNRLIHRADARWLGGRVKPGHGEVFGLLTLPMLHP